VVAKMSISFHLLTYFRASLAALMAAFSSSVFPSACVSFEDDDDDDIHRLLLEPSILLHLVATTRGATKAEATGILALARAAQAMPTMTMLLITLRRCDTQRSIEIGEEL
jgi:hypothetical protein